MTEIIRQIGAAGFRVLKSSHDPSIDAVIFAVTRDGAERDGKQLVGSLCLSGIETVACLASAVEMRLANIQRAFDAEMAV